MKRAMRAAVTALALMATTGEAMAAAKDLPCLTKREASAIFLSIMPAAVEQVTGACARTLPADAYLVRSGAALIARYEGPAKAARPEAITAFKKALGGDLPIEADEFDLFAKSMMTDLAVDKISARDCVTVSETAELIDPLPPANLAALFVKVYKLGIEDKKGEEPPFLICDGG